MTEPCGCTESEALRELVETLRMRAVTLRNESIRTPNLDLRDAARETAVAMLASIGERLTELDEAREEWLTGAS